jgi:hypothetical protein
MNEVHYLNQLAPSPLLNIFVLHKCVAPTSPPSPPTRPTLLADEPCRMAQYTQVHAHPPPSGLSFPRIP